MYNHFNLSYSFFVFFAACPVLRKHASCVCGCCIVRPLFKFSREWGELVTRVRKQDVQLLKTLNVKLICDLMVEKRKTKYGLQ